MIGHFSLDAVALERDPNLAALAFDPGLHKAAFNSDVGQKVYALITSRFGVASLIAAITVSPSSPPVVAVEPLLFDQVGPEAFSDDLKKLAGRVVRFVIEHLGGRWEGRGVRVTTASRYKSGSVYSFSA